MNREIKILFWGCILILTSSLTSPVAGTSNAIHFDASDYRIEINGTYNGTKLKVTGEYPRHQDIILKLEGEPQTIDLNRKGKWLFLWMNVAHVKVENAPQIYHILSKKEIQEISIDSVLIPLNIGYAALKQRIQFSSDESLNGEEFSDFIKLQEHQDRYRVVNGSIDFESASSEMDRFSAVFNLPAMVPPGTYTLTGYCFRDGVLESLAASRLVIEKKGLPLLITNLAFKSAAVYGIVAILAAILAGLLMGVVFGRRVKAH